MRGSQGALAAVCRAVHLGRCDAAPVAYTLASFCSAAVTSQVLQTGKKCSEGAYVLRFKAPHVLSRTADSNHVLGNMLSGMPITFG